MKVKAVMTPEPKACARSTTVAEAARLMWQGDCGSLPVVESGAVVGVVTDRDMYIALATRNVRASELTVGEVATGTVVVCGPDDDLHAAVDLMKTHRVRRLPVVDGRLALVGVLSMNDVVLAAGAPGSVRSGEVINALKAVCAHRAPEHDSLRLPEPVVSVRSATAIPAVDSTRRSHARR